MPQFRYRSPLCHKAWYVMMLELCTQLRENWLKEVTRVES